MHPPGAGLPAPVTRSSLVRASWRPDNAGALRRGGPTMFKDCRGLDLTTTSQQAATAFDHAIDSYLDYRADMLARMEALLAADAGFGLAHCLCGYLLMMAYRADALPAARAALAAARRCPCSPREQAHATALAHWI